MSIFSRLFTIFIIVIIIPLIPMGVLLFSYQKHAKENLLQNHLNLAKMATSNISQHIENPSFLKEYPQDLIDTSNSNNLFWRGSFFSLLTKIQQNTIGKSGILFLANTSGDILTSHTPSFNEDQLANILAKQSNIIRDLSYNNHTFVGAYYQTPLEDAYVISLQDKREIFYTINLITLLIIFFMLVTLTFSYFAALYFARKITKPMDQLLFATKQISKRNFKIKIDTTKSWDELKEVLTTFNNMAHQLDRHHKIMLEQKINQLKEDLFNAIAHDLKVPLLSAQGYLEGVKSKKITAEKREEYIESTKTSLLDISTLIEDILDTARLESTKMKPALKAQNFESMLKKVLREINYQAQNKNIKIVAELKTKTKILCDKKLLERVLLNLISNAIKFSKKNGKITITYEMATNNFKISVKDNGIGINKKELGLIFNKFHKLSNQKGYGLGLFISKLIVKMHGGKITATSTKTKGTTITCLIPTKTKRSTK
ncbi:MAG: HAMP domain-containing histidine kinase [Elusimicrobiaceae bacterium]|mgnify:FL=1|jgi:signal transduction histidine kinase|nr:HAMP domain-containing histidine kinase [Elusimicrobiaceae bacterium]MBT3954861.1 HAMP domain-containing histidine kinase [Elusimicrobiaceae bacterium]MBT4008392.1 HAMP domain-containing histidine kinase [Elusimicrobiaceae bacterium]MBT4402920.1 HAMP domain-containing histidine kinase [Elusimicrobiaceae bacterium]MBT4439856.1 HAMP domain-containing histidine kinase [Elusimicrobiaceae bacterium]